MLLQSYIVHRKVFIYADPKANGAVKVVEPAFQALASNGKMGARKLSSTEGR